MNRRRLLPAVAALCVALTACGVPDGGGGGERFVPAGEQARALVLPFDEHTLSPFEIRTLGHAEDLLVRDCMREHGMGWEVLPAPEEEGTDPPHRRRYGVIEARTAERHGYGVAAAAADEARVEEVREGRQSLPATEHRVAHGDETGPGCLEEAARDMAEGVPDMDHALLNSYIETAFESSLADPAVADALATWSACMADRGFDYGEPSEAADDARWRGRGGDPSDEEVGVATADVDCKEEVALVATWRDAEAAVQHGLIEEHPEDFALFAQVRQDRLERAREVMERAGA